MIRNDFNLEEKSLSRNRNMKLFPIFRLLGIALLLTTLLAANTQSAKARPTFVVMAANEGDDVNPGNGICATATGACTLRAAIEESNANPGADLITFNLPGGGVHVISITAGPLPIITDSVTIDGTSQPNCAIPCIVLSGAVIGGANNGLIVNANGSTIKGFIVTSWGNDGIAIVGDSNSIQSNDIGFWPGNPTLLPNGQGILILGSHNFIGGGPGQRNVISGNASIGINIGSGCCAVTSNTIQGNYIGTNVLGSGALGNHGQGIFLSSLANNSVILNNVISGNLGWGIELAGATNTLIRGNKIGANAAGTGALGNRLGGVAIDSDANTNTIGGTANGQPNNISYNHGVGILVVGASTVNNRIQHNSIFANTSLGINLGSGGVTPNDLGDPDAGPNQTQNFPVLTSATGSTFTITGRLNSLPADAYTVEFFSSPAATCDPSGYGEGKKFVGSKIVTTNALGNVSFSFTGSIVFGAGEVITATATDASGNTSEFSLCRIAN
ncbi:MAG: hypothetical protein WA821_02520 [Anaerolineales bacterium]